jgi:hypothetical protein
MALDNRRNPNPQRFLETMDYKMYWEIKYLDFLKIR